MEDKRVSFSFLRRSQQKVAGRKWQMWLQWLVTQFYQLQRNDYLLRQDARIRTSRSSRSPSPWDRAALGS